MGAAKSAGLTSQLSNRAKQLSNRATAAMGKVGSALRGKPAASEPECWSVPPSTKENGGSCEVATSIWDASSVLSPGAVRSAALRPSSFAFLKTSNI